MPTSDRSRTGSSDGRVTPASREAPSGTDIGEFARFVAHGLAVEEKVSLGFECPLWIPVAHEPSRLTRARPGENDRAWSAAAGATSLTTGLAQVAWILDRIRRQSEDTEAYLDWSSFQRSQSGLFIWEALVTGRAKAGSDEADAIADCPVPAPLQPRTKRLYSGLAPNLHSRSPNW